MYTEMGGAQWYLLQSGLGLTGRVDTCLKDPMIQGFMTHRGKRDAAYDV